MAKISSYIYIFLYEGDMTTWVLAAPGKWQLWANCFIWWGMILKHRHLDLSSTTHSVGHQANHSAKYINIDSDNGFVPSGNNPDSKVHEANMGPFWGRQDPGGPHSGPMNFAMGSHYLNQCWPRSVLLYNITRPQSATSEWSAILLPRCDLSYRFDGS